LLGLTELSSNVFTTVREAVVNSDAVELAQEYIKAGALGKASRNDAFHVAVATVTGADLILNWNFKHIVNYDRIRQFNSVNMLQGYRQIDIRSPLEVEYGS